MSQISLQETLRLKFNRLGRTTLSILFGGVLFGAAASLPDHILIGILEQQGYTTQIASLMPPLVKTVLVFIVALFIRTHYTGLFRQQSLFSAIRTRPFASLFGISLICIMLFCTSAFSVAFGMIAVRGAVLSLEWWTNVGGVVFFVLVAVSMLEIAYTMVYGSPHEHEYA